MNEQLTKKENSPSPFPQEYLKQEFEKFFTQGIGSNAVSTQKESPAKTAIKILLNEMRKLNSEEERNTFYENGLENKIFDSSKSAWYVPFLMNVCGHTPTNEQYELLLQNLTEISNKNFNQDNKTTLETNEIINQTTKKPLKEQEPLTREELSKNYENLIFQSQNPLKELNYLIMFNISEILKADENFQKIKNNDNVTDIEFRTTIKSAFTYMNDFMKPIVQTLIEKDPKFTNLGIILNNKLNNLKRDADLFEEFSYLDLQNQDKVQKLELLYPGGFQVKNSEDKIPWAKIVDYEASCIMNHGQTLATLYRRKGLTIEEIYGALHGIEINEDTIKKIGKENMRTSVEKILEVKF